MGETATDRMIQKIHDNGYSGFGYYGGDWYCVSHAVKNMWDGSARKPLLFAAGRSTDLTDADGATVLAWHDDSFQYEQDNSLWKTGIHCDEAGCDAWIVEPDWDLALETVFDDVPDYIQDATYDHFVVITSDWEGQHTADITPEGVALYYYRYARGGQSVRMLGGVLGDWRMMNDLAGMAYHWFQHINPGGMARELEKLGLELVR